MEHSERMPETPQRLRWLGLAAMLSMAVVAWEYLLNTLINPDVSWNLVGIGAHMALDLAMVLPLALCALVLGIAAARRMGMERSDSAGLLGTIGLVAILFAALMLPVTSGRDLAHEWVGNTYGLSLAEVETVTSGSDLTVTQSTQLCSFGSVRNPSLARDSYQSIQATVFTRLAAGTKDILVQQAAFLPFLLMGLFLFFRREMPRWNAAPAYALMRYGAHPVRLGAIATGAFVLFCVGYGFNDPGSVAHASIEMKNTFSTKNACLEGGTVKEYNVSAIDVEITLNRWGDHIKGGHMYALDANIPAIREFEAALREDRDEDEVLGDPDAVARVSYGLRKDPIQPMVIRANLGECLRINFTNQLGDGEPASMHILGLPHTAINAASAVGNNPDTMADPGETITYEIPVPEDWGAERAYYFHDHGAGRRRQNMGLFGAIVAEPPGSVYRDVETGEQLDTITGSNWEAIVVVPENSGTDFANPGLDGGDNKSFREFVIFYHEIGDESFTDIRDRENKKMPLIDDVAGVYRPAARALNYRSEPFRRRIEFDKEVNGKKAGHAKGHGYASYPFGDPPTPIPRSYVGEGVKTRLLHGGSEVFHNHHLHGGGDRWRRNPNADPKNDFWKGLTKIPDPNLTSIHLDSQSIGPGTSYTLENECGAGGCQQGVGEFLFHCHIGHHYIAGMWAFWRVFGTIQTEDSNVNGFPLAVIPEVFQATAKDTGAVTLPATTAPEAAISAGDLVGIKVDDGKTLVQTVTNPATEMSIEDWLNHLLPPAGKRIDNDDATVMDWIVKRDDAGNITNVYTEPETTMAFTGWVSKYGPEVTGDDRRPELTFNPKNGRYTWPMWRPQPAQRMPFTPRHTGAPWLGEEMNEGRLDGLCATKDLVPGIGETAVKRFYPVSAITLPIQITKDKVDPDGQIFALNEEIDAIRTGEAAMQAGTFENGMKRAEPLAVRSNVGDCVEITFTNQIPDSDLNKNFSKVNIHSHFVQFDTQASDGVITGYSFEQSVRPFANENRRLISRANAGSTSVTVNDDTIDRLHPDDVNGGAKGIWFGIGLGEATCGFTSEGQPNRCQEIRRITGIDIPGDGSATIHFDEPLRNNHRVGEAVGTEFVRYFWYSDVDFGTVFYHTHVEFKDWDHGLFGTHIVEPKGSSYHNPVTGEEVRSGTYVDIRVDPSAGGNPVAYGVHDGNGNATSFREFMLFLHNNNTAEGQFTLGGGTINLRAEPWRLREGVGAETGHRFSSVTHGDPQTQVLHTYVGDPFVIRGMGLVERVGGVRFTGHRFHQERYTDKSDMRDTTYIGISERFDVSLDGGAGGPQGYPGDYLYYSTLGKDFESGAWGILRAHDTPQADLQPLPQNGFPDGDIGFPTQSHTGDAPASLEDNPGKPCPGFAPERRYNIVVDDRNIYYNDATAPAVNGVVFRLDDADSNIGRQARTPLVLRANEGDCVELRVRNNRNVRSSISAGEMLFDPQRSYGSAVGFNYDSTIAPGESRRYRYYADEELGTTLALNLGDIRSVENGAFATIIIEPKGSTWTRPGSSEALPGGGAGVQADIHVDGGVIREVVAMFSDQDRRIGQNAMPYPKRVENFNGINYSAEPLELLRGMNNAPADVFKSSIWGDPRHVVTVPSGTPLIYRVAQPWGNQVHVPTLEGHRWFMEPGMAGSEQMFNDVLAPGMTLDLYMVGGAGGGIDAEGDYLFLDRRQPFLEGGLWNILRVTNGASGGTDHVNVIYTDVRDGVLLIRGQNSIRPAGDHADSVTVDDCAGNVLGVARVIEGSGNWRLKANVGSAPAQICVTSSGGGTTTAGVGM